MKQTVTHTDELPLPGILAEIERVAGRDAALAVAGAKGGNEVYLPTPRSLTDDHWLVVTVGFDAAEKFCAHFRTPHLDDRHGREHASSERDGHGHIRRCARHSPYHAAFARSVSGDGRNIDGGDRANAWDHKSRSDQN